MVAVDAIRRYHSTARGCDTQYGDITRQCDDDTGDLLFVVILCKWRLVGEVSKLTKCNVYDLEFHE